jgi:hypothetical protein
VAGSTFWFLEAAPVSVRFRAAEAGSGWAAALACLAEAHLLAPEVDFHEPADDFLARVVGFHAPVAGSPWQAVDSRERADGLAADSHEPEVDSLARAGEPEVELLVPAADFRARVAALADSAVVHSHAPAADSLGWAELAVDSLVQVADSLARADEPGVELLVPAADFRAWVAAPADSAVVHSHAPAADSLGWAGELAVELPVPAADFRAWVAALADSAVVHSHAPAADSRELAAPSGSPELARSPALAVDCRVPLVSPVVLRSAYLAALPAAFLLRVAAADWLAALRLCLPAALERASH